MKIIEFNEEARSYTLASKPMLLIRKNKITLSGSTAKFLNVEEKGLYMQFAVNDEGQLHLRMCSEEKNTILFKKQHNQQFTAYKTAAVNTLKKTAGREDSKMDFLIANANEEGWHPVITNYKPVQA